MRRMAMFGLALACLAVLLLAVFGRVLFQDHQFAFQDAGHYYYPLLLRVQQEWEAGRWPLWAPEASAGTPLLGNPTAAVLYPGKLLFFLLPYPWAMRVYVIGHVALAFWAMWALLRGWRVSATGSVLGALAYAFGVPVLSQTSNMIFLVGAAWAPLGFLAADRWARCRRRAAVPGLAMVLALQVLGGDPEAAYVTLVCAAGYAAGLAMARSPLGVGRWLRRVGAGLIAVYLGLLGLSWWSARAIHALSVAASGMPAPWKPPTGILVAAAWGVGAAVVAWRARGGRDAREFAAMIGGLIGAAALALAVTGAQLLPVLEYTGMSFRAAESEGFHDIYPYSAHPLQFLDAIWPSVFGTLEGGYRSWLNALPPKPDSRLWMPSVYLGGLTLVLAAAAAGFRGEPPWRTWLSVVAVVSLLAALGYYGSPLLWARCVPGWDSALGPIEPAFSWQVRSDGYLRDGDGGIYWLLASALPGFRSFRYPPKLLVFWALAVSALAGMGWDRLVAGQSRRAQIIAGCLLAASLIALAASWLVADPLRAWFDGLAEVLQSSDEPLDVVRALADLRAALGHGAVAAAVALGLAVLAARRPARAGVVAIGMLVLDLCLANAYHVVTVPQAAFEGTPRALEVIRDAERANPSPGPFRVQRVGRWWPTQWSASGAPRRFEEITRWERDSLRPNYGLPLGVRSTFYFDTIEPLDYGLFFLPWTLLPDPASVRAHDLRPGQKVWYYPRRGFDLWNTRYFIVPARLVWDSPARGYAAFIPRSTFIYPALGSFEGPDGPARRAHWEATDDFRVLRNEAAFPRAWVVHRAYLIPRIRGLRVADRAKLMQELLYQDDEFWHLPGVVVRDPHSVAWVETDRPKEIDRFLSRAGPDPAETVTVTRDEPQRVELTAVLRTPGLVIISDMYYPGWNLTVDGRPAEILRTNRAMRGVALPAGTHRLVFRYDPLSFRLGIALSLLGLTTLAALVAWALGEPSYHPSKARWQ
ncbi:MAG: YfhO family protein [Isosphaeraceae bacterium]|nr:YfhO family protein [Isosphaeraceae bacterium]